MKWEYLKIKDKWEDVQKAGKEKWELVYSAYFGGSVYYVLKRPLKK